MLGEDNRVQGKPKGSNIVSQELLTKMGLGVIWRHI